MHEPSIKWLTKKQDHHQRNRHPIAKQDEAAAPAREDGFLRSYFGRSRHQILSRAAHEPSMQWLADIKSHRLTTSLQTVESQAQQRRSTAQRLDVLRGIAEPSSQGMLKLYYLIKLLTQKQVRSWSVGRVGPEFQTSFKLCADS